MGSDGNNIRQLTSDGKSMQPAFTGSGEIVFVSYRDGPFEIYAMDASGGNVQRLTTTGSGSQNLSPDSL